MEQIFIQPATDRHEAGFTIVEVIVTVVVVTLFIAAFFQSYALLTSQSLVIARRARASDIAYTNLHKVSVRPAALTQAVCTANANSMDLTLSNAATEPGLDITAYGYALESASSLKKYLGTSATQSLVAFAPNGCANFNTSPVKIVATVTLSSGNTVTEATYVQ